ncbi:LysE family translocator [Cognatishimia activa]|uniref:LysE family translocator n=1 Tax=Cognatishimia activa TaxID=1715691 RepID=UPI00222E55AF|nr:LysE family translocator [Cognatishimia activa]UZD91397.1 LysE family translocator [Cognatishimia activa]
MTIETYLVFLITTAVVCFTPGAAAITVASQGAANGGRKAFAGVVGIASANVIYFILSGTGIASLIVASNLLFQIIKWVGVAYLLWLGVTAIFSANGPIKVSPSRTSKSTKKLYVQGFVIEFANPKALMYFAAILPQFLNPEMPILPQILIMGVTTLAIDLMSYTAYGFLGDRIAAGGLRKWVVGLINKSAGAALIFAGIRMASVSAR